MRFKCSGLVSLGVMNLILAVIVESAAEAREADLAQKQKMKMQEQALKKIELLELCTSLDSDSSNSISLAEMKDAWAARFMPATL